MSKPNLNNLEQSHSFRHSLPLQIRFNDVDMFGHINNAIYLQYFDLGKLRYFEDVLGKDYILKGFTAAIVNINCNFYSPSYINEELDVQTAVISFGDKSFTLEQQIVGRANRQVKCACRTIMAGIDLKTNSSTSIPRYFIDKIREFESANTPE